MSVRHEPETEDEVLAAVEALVTRRRPAFPHWLEARFEAETGARYRQILAQDVRRTAIYYNLMTAGDFLLAPDVVPLALVGHFLIVTPLLLGVAWLCRFRLPPLARDIAAACAPFFIGAQVMGVFVFSRAPTASHYLFFVAMNVFTVNTAMRLRYRSASWSTYATFLALPIVLLATRKMPVEVAVMQWFSLVMCGLITLRGMADREREFRRGYLNGLRDRLRIAASDQEANRDPLTGAANRRGLLRAVRKAWADLDPLTPAAVILFDVDRFKAYNDLYGHPSGDACLRQIAAAVTETARARNGLLARYGGEEFLVLQTGPDANDAEDLADEMRRAVLALNIPHAGAVERRFVSASFGVARGPVGAADFEALTSAADMALYQAKSAGRNQVATALAA